ncbi:hypothetical protein [Hoeflea olei]|uniref:Uncharacterized protein n=1 Tax=Hoeflea olei TaxID=1480615 RepID=A0A1C1YZF4_9HYPH|nr:hypothetical protein [Hoeflea olei]OCW58855.1 hypothetical protein AWJ14_20970 [Hoeflea olei]
MSIGVLVVLVTFGVLVVVAAVHYSGGSKQVDTRDPGEAIMEFARAYPDEAIRSVTMTMDGKACFLRLADGKVGFLQAMGHHFIARLIMPGSVAVKPLEDEPGLEVTFHDSTLKGGNYVFLNREEAAEVSLWLCGSFVLASPKFDGPGGGDHA